MERYQFKDAAINFLVNAQYHYVLNNLDTLLYAHDRVLDFEAFMVPYLVRLSDYASVHLPISRYTYEALRRHERDDPAIEYMEWYYRNHYHTRSTRFTRDLCKRIERSPHYAYPKN